jgi:hypothetical protein
VEGRACEVAHASWSGRLGSKAELEMALARCLITVGTFGWEDGEHWGSGDKHHTSLGIKGEVLDKARGAGV